jgi:parvulin-like peptidyl-prolyl isomerase
MRFFNKIASKSFYHDTYQSNCVRRRVVGWLAVVIAICVCLGYCTKKDPLAYIAWMGDKQLTHASFLDILKQINPDYFLPYGKMASKLQTDKQLLRQLLEEYLLDEALYQEALAMNIETQDAFVQFLKKKEPEFYRYANEILLLDEPLRETLTITDTDLELYQVQYRVRHILLTYPNRQENYRIAVELTKQIDSLDDFIHYQQLYPQRSRLFGLTDETIWVTPDAYPAHLSDLWFSLSDGTCSSPKDIDGGWYLFFRVQTERVSPFERIELRYIFLPYYTSTALDETKQGYDTKEAAVQQLQQIHHQILQDPEAMPHLAVMYSNDPINSKWGGGLNSIGKVCTKRTDLEWVYPESIRLQLPGMYEQLLALPIGQVSEPIESSRGMHIIRVEDMKRRKLEDIRSQRKVMGVVFGTRYEEETIKRKQAIVRDYQASVQRYPESMYPEALEKDFKPEQPLQPFLILPDGRSFTMLDLPPSSHSYQTRMMRFITEAIVDYGLTQEAKEAKLYDTAAYQELRQVFLRGRMIEFLRISQRRAIREIYGTPTPTELETYWEQNKNLYQGKADASLSNPVFYKTLEERMIDDYVEGQFHTWNVSLVDKYQYHVNTTYFTHPDPSS